jgi:hypothetical protein
MVPPSGQQFGCVDAFNDRFNQYLFTGEQMAVLVVVRDVQGAAAIGSPVQLNIGGADKSICTDITSLVSGNGAGAWYTPGNWFGHNVDLDLQQQPPAIGSGSGNGFDHTTDKLYQCVYQAVSDDSGLTQVTVDVMDIYGLLPSVNNAMDFVYFNPEILVDVTTSDGSPISFAPGSAGSQVYSLNTLQVTNEAQGGVILYAWLAATDLTSSTGSALCPLSNVLSVVQGAVVGGNGPNAGLYTGMEYRCKIGTLMNNPWHYVTHPNDKEDCKLNECQGAEELLPDVTVISSGPHTDMGFLTVGSMAECWFRLTYPIPCIGSFDNGNILIYARAI